MTDPTSPATRRRHPRRELSLLVQYRSNTFEDFLADYAINLSPGGMFIRTDDPHEVGELIYLQFSLKDGSKLIEGLGKVVWVNEPAEAGRVSGMGIEFLNFDEESSALVAELCGSRGPKE